MNKAMLLKQYMQSGVKNFIATPELVYTLSSDGSYYIVGTGFTSLSSIESDTSGGNAGSGLNSSWSGGDLYIPNTYNGKPVKAIAPKSFMNITNIVNVVVQEGITHFGHRCFLCDSAEYNMKTCVLPKTLTYFGGDTCRIFRERRALTKIIIPEGLTIVGQQAFYNCVGLTSATIPNSVKYMGAHAFYSCTSLTKINIPEGITSLEKSLVCGCSVLENVIIPNSVTKIGDFALSYCYAFTELIIPEKVTSIGSWAFDYNRAMTSITILAQTPPTLGTDAFRECTGLTTIYVPKGKLSAYRNATNWSAYASKFVELSE